MRTDLPTGTVTFLFTDVEGSTKLLHELGAEDYARALSEHRRDLRDSFQSRGGVEVDTQGDAFFYAFPDAGRALTAAGDGQDALREGPIRVRMGLHTGTPYLAEEGYVGDDVHLAARIGACAHGGQIICSKATADLVSVELQDLGEHRLKDIAEPVAIYQLGPERFPPLKTISNTNLPRPASSFVGREKETADVVALLRDGARLVTLSGPGGSGKTRLSIEAASELVGDLKAGVFWVGLAALRDSELVTETIAQTLGAKDSLEEHIGERELLLLLDNLEQVIDCAPQLACLLETCPNLRLLCTSRELLRVRGEVEYAVPPLAEPEAVELFCQRSQLPPDDSIAGLCRRLDDLPLAVELAAARTAVLTPAQILERLSQRLDLLKGGRDAEARQQTLRATIEWSYELLSAEEQQLFGRLSVFASGCTLEAAEEVAEADLDTLQSLVDKSLVRFTNERYWMLETIREYATEKLEASAEAATVRLQHARCFLRLAEEAENGIRAEQEGWLGRLELEQDNLRAALESARLEGMDDLLVRLVGSLGIFWFLHADLVESRGWLAEALERVPDGHMERGKLLISDVMVCLWRGELDRAETRVTELLDLLPGLDARGRADALHVAAVYHSSRAELSDAAELWERSAAISREAGETWLLRQTLNNLGDVALRVDDHERARRYFEEAVALTGGDLPTGSAGAVAALACLACLDAERGDRARARERFREVLDLLSGSRLREVGITGPALVGVALLLADDGDPEAAARILAAAAAFTEDLGFSLPPYEAGLRARAEKRLRSLLSPSEHAELEAEGRALGLDEAVEYARERI